jgi:predicted transcriptional regulator
MMDLVSVIRTVKIPIEKTILKMNIQMKINSKTLTAMTRKGLIVTAMKSNLKKMKVVSSENLEANF